jgi:sugar-specific transcriptional regulator TrmB
MNRIESYLTQLGLSEAERQIYLMLLKKGTTSVTELAQYLKMNRVTLHFHLKEMISQGIISDLHEGRTRHIRAESPDIFEQIIADKRKRIENLRQQYEDVRKRIEKRVLSQTHSNLEAKMYKGNKSVRLLYQDILQAGEIRAYVADKFRNYFPDLEATFISTHRKRKKMKLWEIMDESPRNDDFTDQMDQTRYWCKILPGKLDVIDYVIYEGKVMYVDAESTDKESVKAYVIENENIFQNAKRIFDYMWSVLPGQDEC